MSFICSIGYPVVTLGFGFKSYVGYRMRQRKQREVAKENEFYMQLLQQALPQEEILENNEQTASQLDVQHREFSAVTAVTPLFNGSNNNSFNNNKNAQSNNKNNHSIHNNTNGHVIASSNVCPPNTASSQMSNGVNYNQHNHIHNSNSHKSSNHRRSLDKDSTSNPITKISLDHNFSNENKSSSSPTTTIHKHVSSSKESRSNVDQKPEQFHQHVNSNNSESTSPTIYTSSKIKLNHNGSVHNFEVAENQQINELAATEIPLERQKSGRKNRVRQKNTESKELSSKSSSESVANCNNLTSSTSTLTSFHISQHQQTSPQICESCCRLESDIRKIKHELSHLKQTENDLRQKHESNLNYKSCLQAKQKEYDELEKR